MSRTRVPRDVRVGVFWTTVASLGGHPKAHFDLSKFKKSYKIALAKLIKEVETGAKRYGASASNDSIKRASDTVDVGGHPSKLRLLAEELWPKVKRGLDAEHGPQVPKRKSSSINWWV